MAGEIIEPQFSKGESEEDRLINSYYCGQMLVLHYLIHYIFKAKYPMRYVLRWIEARYTYLMHEYPNFYNQLRKSDRELGNEAGKAYKVMFEEMMKHYKQLFKDEDRPS